MVSLSEEAQKQKASLVIEKEPFHVIASWMKNPSDDQDQEYEYEMSLNIPGGSALDVGNGKFRFAEGRPLHRFTAIVRGLIPFKEPGLMVAECRIRRVGSKGWMRQNYPVMIEFTDPQTVHAPVQATPTESTIQKPSV